MNYGKTKHSSFASPPRSAPHASFVLALEFNDWSADVVIKFLPSLLNPKEIRNFLVTAGEQIVSYRLTLDAFCKKSVAIEMPQCHPAYAVMV